MTNEVSANRPLVTIMVPVYNQEQLVIEALESIPKRSDIELIIIDDKSTDNTGNTLVGGHQLHAKDFGNVILERNRQNMGCGYSKNGAYTKAQGKYIITLDSDDYLYTSKYDSVLNKLQDKDADIIFIANDANDGSIGRGTDRKATWSYFVRNDGLKSTGLNYDPEARRAGDLTLTFALRELPHTEEKWSEVVYHYNYPREGSIVGNFEHGSE